MIKEGPDMQQGRFTYEEACSYIDEIPKFMKKNSLDHTRECLRLLGNPQDRFGILHVAGTNGKGSTCAFLASILKNAGYRCGLFTSPHLVSVRERFLINGDQISEEDFLAVFHKVKDLCVRLAEEGKQHPTYFEMLFLMGMVYFAEKKTELVVLETGLGGRLDATTAAGKPLACVITSISPDHTEYLGNTVEEIAGEKAGILVPGVPVIYDADHPAAAEVIAAAARDLSCPAYAVRRNQAELISLSARGIDFRLKADGEKGCVFHLPFLAEYQVANASLAIMTIRVLTDILHVSEQEICTGLDRTRWPGRMEMMGPGVIADGAHNEDGIRCFIETAKRFAKDTCVDLLFSAVNDKNFSGMIREICEGIPLRNVTVTEVGGYRRVSCESLAEIFLQNGCERAEAIADPQEALRHAMKIRGEGLLFCVGSLYLIGQVRQAFFESGRKKES